MFRRERVLCGDEDRDPSRLPLNRGSSVFGERRKPNRIVKMHKDGLHNSAKPKLSLGIPKRTKETTGLCQIF
jgi:hypothetical protein